MYYHNQQSQLRTTADKREIKDFPKLPSATSSIRGSLGDISKRGI
jgi:hypothetical protein